MTENSGQSNTTVFSTNNTTEPAVETKRLSDYQDPANLTTDENQYTNITNYDIDASTLTSILYGLCIFSALTIIVNCIILVASQFTTGGKSATLVFIRSLCIADILIGVYGVFKTLLLNNLENRVIKCFLPESILVSGTTALCLTLLWLNLDTYFRLARPFRYANCMNKGNTITAMMLLWNAAFIISFLPQLGWSVEEFECNFFKFYSINYVIFVCLIWTLCILGSGIMQVMLSQLMQGMRHSSNTVSSRSVDFLKYSQLIITIRSDVILWILAYVPFVIYITIYFSKHIQTEHAHNNLIFFIPIFLLRSFLSAFIHGYRTVSIQRVINIKERIRKAISQDTSEYGSDLPQSTMQSETPNHIPISVISQTNRKHKKLCATQSVITIVTEEAVCDQIHEVTTYL